MQSAARMKDAAGQVAVRDDLLGTVNRALGPAEAWIWTAGGGGCQLPYDLGTVTRETALSSSLADLGENP